MSRLESVPSGVLVEIYVFVGAGSLPALAATSRDAAECARTPLCWRRLLEAELASARRGEAAAAKLRERTGICVTVGHGRRSRERLALAARLHATACAREEPAWRRALQTLVKERNDLVSARSRRLALLDHCVCCAGGCDGVPRCRKLKLLLAHGRSCPVRLSRGCAQCERLWQLLATHAGGCRTAGAECRVPYCAGLRAAERREVLSPALRYVLSTPGPLRRHRRSAARRAFSRLRDSGGAAARRLGAVIDRRRRRAAFAALLGDALRARRARAAFDALRGALDRRRALARLRAGLRAIRATGSAPAAGGLYA